MHKKALVALSLSVFAAATAAAQTSPNLAIGSAQPPDSIFAASGPSCIGGVEADDGTFETGYVALGGIESRMVQRLTPPVHPSLLTRACLCWISENASASTLSYQLVVYDDNGPGGGPGTPLGTRAVIANGVSSTAPTFFGYDCSLLDIGVTSGSIYVGAVWDRIANPDFFLCADESTSTPPAKIYASNDAGAHWTPLQDLEPRARAVGVRAEFFANGCIPDDFTLCLQNGRFAVQATFQAPGGPTTAAHVAKLTDQTGYLWFFNEENVEAVIKVLDACSAPTPRFWVFAGGLTNVRTVITVTDKQENNTKVYVNPQGTAFKPIQDTNAFATCGG